MTADRACERHQMDLSAWLDGEIDPHTMQATLDHLLDCPDCTRFYREARGLQAIVERLEPATVDAVDAVAGTAVVTATAPNAARPRWVGWLRPTPAWAWAAVVLVAAAAGLWGTTRWFNPSAPVDSDRVVAGEIGGESADEASAEIQLGDKAEPMNEERFVELTVALLRANPRYQEEMSEVLKQVARVRSEDGGDAL
jgi:anti-sigma factor RsiW